MAPGSSVHRRRIQVNRATTPGSSTIKDFQSLAPGLWGTPGDRYAVAQCRKRVPKGLQVECRRKTLLLPLQGKSLPDRRPICPGPVTHRWPSC